MTENEVRVLHVSLWLTPVGGGIQKYLSIIATAAANSGIASRYAALMPGSPPLASMKVAHVGTARAPKWVNALRLWVSLNREMATVDVVHVHGVLGWPFVVAALVCRHKGKPYVVSPHGSLYPWFLSQRRLRARLYLALLGKRLLRQAVTVVANLPAEERVVRQLDPRIHVTILPPAIPAPPERGETRAETTDGGLRIVFVSRVEPLKGIPVLLKALALLHRQRVSARLDVIGPASGPHVAQLRSLAGDLGIEQALTFHGYVSEAVKRQALRSAHVFCMPSYGEAFSFATAEALAEGLPVVVSDSVALADTVRKYRCGTVVPTDDAPSLADALASYADPEFRKPRSQRARECAREAFSLDQMKRSLESLYRTALHAAG